MIRLCLFVFVVSLFVGCDARPRGDLPPLFPAKGKVVRGDEGIAGAIRLRPANSTPESDDLIIAAELKPDGTFELSTIHALSQKKALGVPAGEYQVTYQPPLGDQTTTSDGNLGPVVLPDTCTIQPGPNDLTIRVGK